ncbi:type II toxin-antitoxin system RelE/ParE family toxin [Prosthecochloris sp. SCSIO W1103]|uniref:type II toxin-antitoxin system RelE/ParE family toxin n=1 Tax=Prosthecochloris sp. SCSIO W1103 TaxID=2992244 RepID=UPI00223E1797|nr:type II toxin-antitoxin system RelE/ParE family toxin [Prosthecochloris sp. SCSIO W1103]UZJ37737.1 type II toxin-antitoxin system RelE/ParE family toxin [Prosthecochloris sp. SCSIO W1103]
MNVYFSALAQKELQEAVSYYDEISPALGDELLREVEQAKSNILSFPFAWSSAGKEQRKYVLPRFPYLIIYKVYCDRVVVAAFAHQHRLPEDYINRK